MIRSANYPGFSNSMGGRSRGKKVTGLKLFWAKQATESPKIPQDKEAQKKDQ